MSKYTLLHNARCSKSRAGLEFLEENKIDFDLRNIIQEPLSAEELKSVLKKLGMTAEELTRKNDALFKDQFKDKDLKEEDYLKILKVYPSLIERPILIKGDKAVIGRPLENFEKLLQ